MAWTAQSGERAQDRRARGRAAHLGTMPLQRLEAVGDALEQRIAAARIRQLDFEHANLWLGRLADFTAQRGTQQLMAQANPEIGHGAFHYCLADCPLFGGEPGVLILLPDIHGTPHGPELIVARERGDRGALVQLDGVPGNAILRQEVAEDRGMLHVHMLENQNPHPRPRTNLPAGEIAIAAVGAQYGAPRRLSARRPSDC